MGTSLFDYRIFESDRQTGGRPATGSILYFFRHAEIWVDGKRELRRWRNAVHEYAEEILRTRLAEECFRIWHHGEYNFVQRMALRRDPRADRGLSWPIRYRRDANRAADEARLHAILEMAGVRVS
ncbi:MAG: DUF4037 domain-containing protein [Bryobacterales bacterium]|nr:DUF4037 domain-containing protein [Bryobacterales bacterium]MBV9401956.1 DUF4037 domain-containing protein [Bryobacterales bacterium]